jgi:hypothetical protein
MLFIVKVMQGYRQIYDLNHTAANSLEKMQPITNRRMLFPDNNVDFIKIKIRCYKLSP